MHSLSLLKNSININIFVLFLGSGKKIFNFGGNSFQGGFNGGNTFSSSGDNDKKTAESFWKQGTDF